MLLTFQKLDENDIGLCDIENEILVLVREEVLYNIISGNVICRDDPDKEYSTADLGIEVELSCLDNDVSWENIVQDNILDEVVSVILLIVVLLDI